DGLFPHQRSQSDLEGLEEERRLCYVGMTRAMRQLYFTYAEQRRLHGTDTYNAPSRFLEEVRARIRVSQRPADPGRFEMGHGASGWNGTGREARLGGARSALGEALEGGMRLGSRVRHGKFGD